MPIRTALGRIGPGSHPSCRSSRTCSSRDAHRRRRGRSTGHAPARRGRLGERRIDHATVGDSNRIRHRLTPRRPVSRGPRQGNGHQTESKQSSPTPHGGQSVRVACGNDQAFHGRDDSNCSILCVATCTRPRYRGENHLHRAIRRSTAKCLLLQREERACHRFRPASAMVKDLHLARYLPVRVHFGTNRWYPSHMSGGD